MLRATARFLGRFLGFEPRNPFEGILFETARALTREYQGRLLTA